MKRPIIHVTLPICATIVAAGAWWAGAGDLNPPPGAITPTMKTLAEVEPRIAINATNTPGDAGSLFRITQPGSYYLTGNLTGVSGRNGILIAADDVTIDLMGYRLLGGLGTLDGIATDAARNNITIRNGSVSNWANSGIKLVSGGSGFLIEAVQARNNGINGGSAIWCHDNGVVRFCTAVSNFGNGIQTGTGAVIESCTASQNGGDGINVSFGSTVTNCTTASNGDDGIVAFSGTVTNCTTPSNGDTGIVVFAGSTVTNCTAGLNTGDGINASSASAVTNCTVRLNGDDGIFAGDGSTVKNCTAVSSTGDGIQVGSNCRVVGNTCDGNGNNGDGAGIHATSASFDILIQGNHVTSNDRGIDVDGAFSIITRNTAGDNATNYDIAAFNDVGKIQTSHFSATGAWDNFSVFTIFP